LVIKISVYLYKSAYLVWFFR